MCRVSDGTDLMVPFTVFEKDADEEGFGFAAPFRVFMTFEGTGARVRAGALIVSIFKLMPTAGSLVFGGSGVGRSISR